MTRFLLAASAATLFTLSPAFADHHGDHAHNGHGDHAAQALDTELNEDIAAALAAGGSLVTAEVNGMVCDFCAMAMTRTFGRRDEVAAVNVDLDSKVLQLVIRANEAMSDEVIRDLVTRSGYETTAIQRPAAD